MSTIGPQVPAASVAVPWGPFLAWAGVAQVPRSVDNAKDMMRSPGWSLLLYSLREFPPAKSSGHSSAFVLVQALPEWR